MRATESTFVTREKSIHQASILILDTVCLFGTLLAVDGGLFTHSGENDDIDVLALVLEELLNLVADLTIWDLNIVLGGTVIGHERKEAIVSDIEKLVFLAADVWNIHVVSGWAKFFKLLAGEDVDGDKMDLGVTVLASLGGGHFDNLAWAVLDHDETVLAQSRALHRVRGRGTGIGALEGVLLMLGVVGHDVLFEKDSVKEMEMGDDGQ